MSELRQPRPDIQLATTRHLENLRREMMKEIRKALDDHVARQHAPITEGSSSAPETALARSPSRARVTRPPKRARENKAYIPELRPETELAGVPMEEVMKAIQHKEYFVWPRPLREGGARTTCFYCRYHRDYGHTTENCRHLRELVRELLAEGKIEPYILRELRVCQRPPIPPCTCRLPLPRDEGEECFRSGDIAPTDLVRVTPGIRHRLSKRGMERAAEDGRFVVFGTHAPGVYQLLAYDGEMLPFLVREEDMEKVTRSD